MPKIDFLRIYGENIGTYLDPFDVRLDLPGFNLILGDSGAGKSTLWRLLSLLCFSEIEGSNKQRSKTDLFHPIRNKQAFGAVDLSVDGVLYTFRYSKNHKEFGNGVQLLREGRGHSKYTKTETIARIQEVLGITYQQFTTGVYLPQKSSHMMVGGSSGDRWRYVTDLSGCGELDGAILKLRGLLKDQGEAIGRASELAEAMARIDLKLRDAGDFKTLEALESFIDRRRTALANAITRHSAVISAHRRADAVETDRKALLTKIGEKPTNPFAWHTTDIEDVVNLLTDRLSSWDKYRDITTQMSELGPIRNADKLKVRIEKLRGRAEELRSELAIGNRTKSRLKQGRGDVCHVCDQPWPEADRRAAMDVLDKTMSKANTEIAQLLDKAQVVRDQASDSVRRKQLEVQREKPAVSEVALCRRLLVADILLTRASDNKNDADRYESMVSKLREMPDVERPSVSYESAQDSLRACKDKLERWNVKYSRAHDRIETIELLTEERGAIDARLDDIRGKLRRIELLKVSLEAVAELKHRKVDAVAGALAEVAARHYPSVREAVSFGVDLGPRKFDIFINRAEAVSKKRYSLSTRQLSGGEGDKAAIAFMFAIREIVAADVNSNLLVLDEAAAHMDDGSWDLLLERLAESAKGKSVFVMSHRTVAKTAPVWDRVFEVTKKRDVSRIERVR